jgi:cytochrome c oxidase subunit IV
MELLVAMAPRRRSARSRSSTEDKAVQAVSPEHSRSREPAKSVVPVSTALPRVQVAMVAPRTSQERTAQVPLVRWLHSSSTAQSALVVLRVARAAVVVAVARHLQWPLMRMVLQVVTAALVVLRVLQVEMLRRQRRPASVALVVPAGVAVVAVGCWRQREALAETAARVAQERSVN